MNDNIGNGKRLVIRVVLLQIACAAVAAGVFWVMKGAAEALAALSGGLIAAIGSAVFGWRMFLPGIAPAATLHRAMFAAESLKWLWYVLAIWLALTRLKLMPLPLMAGLIFAQFGYWAGLVSKRGKLNGSF
jgi:F0F1-type ATP synthase assembly protein I